MRLSSSGVINVPLSDDDKRKLHHPPVITIQTLIRRYRYCVMMIALFLSRFYAAWPYLFRTSLLTASRHPFCGVLNGKL